ncbi:hypothetical protein CL656_06065 [bacterium]|nr:hypothetical protein [bacterium]
MKSLFWLHIKKSAGQSTRKALKPYYVEVDRMKKPKNFIQSNYSEYNDILNNYRVPLGDYQFKRALFAKKYLYKKDWDSIFSFAFSREPTDRCISMFYYLFWRKKLKDRIYSSIKSKRIFLSDSYAFDYFLELISKRSVNNTSNYSPVGLHFTTHTNPMWDDVTDESGNILLSKIFRLENFSEGITFALKHINANIINDQLINVNINPFKGSFNPSKQQIKKIETIYKEDFDIYESIK